MVIDVGPLLRGEVKKIDIDYMLTPEALWGIEFESDAHVTGALTDNAGYMRLVLKAELKYHGECARCLAPVSGVFSLDFERTVTTEGVLSDSQLEEDLDEYVVIHGSELDVDEPLSEELVLAFPKKLLCSEDCFGLCPKCGKPKREGDCGCPTKEIDPRLAILATLFDKEETSD
ncbi:MAG: DUF177 domain-containing protein [Clostridia bacterium]|nr:DUF177 domain-containing protein [Clostridia bacterium]